MNGQNVKKGMTKKQIACNGIRDMVTNGLASGTPLVERDLCELLGVSRTPVREALRELANEGLVEIIDGKGVYVAKIRFEDMVEIFELREALESYAVKLFVERKDTQDIQHLQDLMAKQEKAYKDDNHKALMDFDMEFHQAIASRTKNKRLYEILVSIYNKISQMAISVRDEQEIRDIAIENHREIMDAIIRGDSEGASKVMASHIIKTKEYHMKRYYLL